MNMMIGGLKLLRKLLNEKVHFKMNDHINHTNRTPDDTNQLGHFEFWTIG